MKFNGEHMGKYNKLAIGKSLLILLVVSFIIFLILTSIPQAIAKKDISLPDNHPGHPEHPERPEHPEHPEHPEVPPLDVGEGDAPSGGPILSEVEAPDRAVEAAPVNYIPARTAAAGTGEGVSVGVGYSVPLPSAVSSETSQLAFFTVSSISVFISCISLVSIFGKKPLPFCTIRQLRDVMFGGRYRAPSSLPIQSTQNIKRGV